METLNLTGRRGLIVSIANEHSLAWSAAQHLNVALSVGVQGMARADLGGAGVMFSIDTETGFDKVVLINAAWGLGENVV
jgi:pyruvate, water dikinase